VGLSENLPLQSILHAGSSCAVAVRCTSVCVIWQLRVLLLLT
jgi:hypothetical protein